LLIVHSLVFQYSVSVDNVGKYLANVKYTVIH